MIRTLLLFFFLFHAQINAKAKFGNDYTYYHLQVVEIETLIANQEYENAYSACQDLFSHYEFVFLRDYQLATQLAVQLNKMDEAKELLTEGIRSGWTLKSIQKNKFLKPIYKSAFWEEVKNDYPKWRTEYEARFNQDLREQVKRLYLKDQGKAFKALFRIGDKAQQRYGENKFAPHSEKQLAECIKILEEYGYPGEKMIGNNYWMSTVLSHHNSISPAYNRKDTLYQHIKPHLKHALKNGQMSAFEYVLIDEWYRVSTDQPTYALLDGPVREDLLAVNKRRSSVYIRPIEVHNKLVDLEEKTGMRFYLDGHPWDKGKIEIKD